MSEDEEQFNPRAHKKLLQGISSLGKSQHIRKSTRSEPLRLQQDEFQLVKPANETKTQHPVGLHDIVKVLKTTKKHLEAGKKLKIVQSKKNVLAKPFEKPQAERVKRGLGYEKAKKNLERWDAVVAKNRLTETQVFPQRTETIYINTALHRRPLQRAIKSDLALELEAEQARLRAAKRALAGETESEADLAKRERELLKRKMTRDELVAKRRELKYLKIRESQKSLKARKQNKIKSKKYHKLLKKQKIQEQIKQFEILQKTNPQAAIEKLNELEKSRVLERASLRHKNTGSWAKNLQIRAKYDKDVRKDLAEQLQISRQLTQKKTNSDDEAEEGDVQDATKVKQMEEEAEVDPFNPWTRVGGSAAKNGRKAEEGGEEGDENWRKYWLERNENEKMLAEYKKLLADEEGQSDDDDDADKKIDEEEDKRYESKVVAVSIQEKANKKINAKQNEASNKDAKRKSKAEKRKAVKVEEKESQRDEAGQNDEDSDENEEMETKVAIKAENAKTPIILGQKSKKIRQKKAKKMKTETVEITAKEFNIDDLFDQQEDKVKARLNRRLEEMANRSKQLKNSQLRDKKQKLKKTKKEKDALKNLKGLSFKQPVTQPDIDEELNGEDIETENKADTDVNITELDLSESGKSEVPPANKPTAEEATKVKSLSADTTTPIAPVDKIDPTKLADVKLKQSIKNFTGLSETIDDDNVIVDMSDGVDDDDEDDDGKLTARAQLAQQMTISEAFEDDDIIADFTRDKEKDTELKDAEIDLFMPGWGSWAGAGISEEKKKEKANHNKRFVLKLAEKEKRRDDNRGDLYINEEARSKQLRAHLVSSLPFPFTSVSAYEDSIRATIGRNCVPETAFRMLTRPAVIVRKGQIIEPMDEAQLTNRPNMLKSVVDRRIARMEKNVKKMKKVEKVDALKIHS